MRRLANASLLVLALGLAAVASATVVVPAATGTQAVTIDRNSMQRVLPYGSLALIAPADHYAVGDDVTFRQNGNVITHRIIALLPNPATAELDGTWFQTMGTENAAPDEIELSRDNIIGKVVAHVPVLGLAPKVLATWPVRIFLALTAIALLYLARSRPAHDAEGLGREVDGAATA